MTYQRVLHRNGIETGGYFGVPDKWQQQVNTQVPAGMTLEQAHFDVVARRLDSIVDQVRLLLGDLRRLEEDATDEKAICQVIASRTNIDADTVAAVLKEFLSY